MMIFFILSSSKIIFVICYICPAPSRIQAAHVVLQHTYHFGPQALISIVHQVVVVLAAKDAVFLHAHSKGRAWDDVHDLRNGILKWAGCFHVVTQLAKETASVPISDRFAGFLGEFQLSRCSMPLHV